MLKPPVFDLSPLRCEVLGPDDLPALQALFETNCGYFNAVNGEPAQADQAQQEFVDRPPEGMPYGDMWLLGVRVGKGELLGMASVIGDFLAPKVWHIGLFMIASRLHGSGLAPRMYGALEMAMRERGAQWIRLGAVVGYAKAVGFWRTMGYTEVRRRRGVPMGKRVNDLHVFVKPLGSATIAEYLQRVERDRPESVSM